LRHHMIVVTVRKHMDTYAKKEKILNPSYKNINLSTSQTTNKASIYKQYICSRDASPHIAHNHYHVCT
jgi:hypothetical protein